MACNNFKRLFKSAAKKVYSLIHRKSEKPLSYPPPPSRGSLPYSQRDQMDEIVTLYSTSRFPSRIENYDGCVVVVDYGTGSIKAGFAIDDEPSCIMPTVVGVPRKGLVSGTTRRSRYVGNQVRQMRGILTYKYPMDRGVVTDWEGMETIFRHCFDEELGIVPSEHPFLLSEIANTPPVKREHLTQIMFESFHVPAMYISLHAILAMYSLGELTGLSFDAGEGITSIVPVYEGQAIRHGIKAMCLAGKDLNEYLMSLINARGFSLYSTTERELVREIKETMCYVSRNFTHELNSASNEEMEATFKLPDGNVIHLGAERFVCPEALFDPHKVGLRITGIHKTIDNSINSCQPDLQREFFKRIVLTGGTTLFPGLESRLLHELRHLSPERKINIIAVPERKISVWKGGAALSMLSTFKQMCITREEYFEIGPTIVHTKCF